MTIQIYPPTSPEIQTHLISFPTRAGLMGFSRKRRVLLSPVPSFTSEPTPRPLRLPISLIITIQPLSSLVPFHSPVKSRSVLHLRTNSESSETSDIPYLFMSRLLSSYLLCSILFIPVFLFVRPFLITMRLTTMRSRFPHAPVSCVDSTSCSYNHSSPRTPVPVPAPPPNL